MTCPAVVKVTVPSGPAVVRVATPGPPGPLRIGQVRVDADTAGIVYVGSAPFGADESDEAWAITKSTFSSAGVRISKGQAVAVAWTNRETAIYT